MELMCKVTKHKHQSYPSQMFKKLNSLADAEICVYHFSLHQIIKNSQMLEHRASVFSYLLVQAGFWNN